MPIDEQEPRQCPGQAAGEAGVPWFTAGELARQIGRQRSMVVTAVTDAVMAAAAVAVAIPVALSATARLPGRHGPPRPPRMSYTVTVNGRAPASPGREQGVPHYVISPGEELSITVDATVPEGATGTAMWLGITDGMLSARRSGPVNMSPVLAARTDTTPSPGAHRFSFRWAVPAELGPGASRQLTAQWAWSGRSPGTSQQISAVLEAPAGASST